MDKEDITDDLLEELKDVDISLIRLEVEARIDAVQRLCRVLLGDLPDNSIINT